MRFSDKYGNHGFFKFINLYFGYNTSKLLKEWKKCHKDIIRTRFQIKLLEKHNKLNVCPRHLMFVYNAKQYFSENYSYVKFDRIKLRFVKNTIKLELNDAHRKLKLLIHRSHILKKDIYRALPFNVCSEFFYTNINILNRHYYRELSKFEKKILWVEKRYKDNCYKAISPIKYYCSVRNPLVVDNSLNTRPTTENNNTRRLDSGGNSFSLNPFLPNVNSVEISISPNNFNLVVDECLSLNKEWFINLSQKFIPEEVKLILQLGEGFSLPIQDKHNFIIEFIKFIEVNIEKFNNIDKTFIRSESIPIFNKILHNCNYNNVDNYLLSVAKLTRKFLRDNEDLMITKADKGNITVAVDSVEYIEKVKVSLSDESTYIPISRNPVNNIRSKLHIILKKWKNLNFITPEAYNKLNITDSVLPRAYGLPKVHKTDIPYRIIVSSIDTSLYPLAVYIHNILDKSLPKSFSSIKNSFQLIEKFSNIHIDNDWELISLDVISLFTNIPLELAINSIKSRWPLIATKTSLPIEEFIGALNLIFDSMFFTFDNVIYKQIFGTPMGSPLSPILADLVMQDLERRALDSMSFIPPLYIRYVDDIMLAVPKVQSNETLLIFNNIHPRLQFTLETSTNNSLNFLDLSISLTNNRLLFDLYKKPTFSGRYLHFLSNHPLTHKKSVIYGLVDRCLKLSNPMFHQKNLSYIIDILIKNGYPLKFIFDNINYRIKSMYVYGRSSPSHSSDDADNKDSHPFFTLPYSNFIDFDLKNFFDKLKVKPAYKCYNKLQNIVKVHKDRLPTLLHKNIVYNINCKDCNASYVGQSRRFLKTRIKEHKVHINRNTSQRSVITEHRLDCLHDFDWDNVSILDEESSYKRRLISEMIFIKKQKKGLNLQSDTDLLDDIYFPTILSLSPK